jgi:8-oxo-dGTP pyrophosphatase MutT (NUDIX family)
VSRPQPDWVTALASAAMSAGVGDLARQLPHTGAGRLSAVLMAFGETEAGLGVLLLQRASSLRNHPGQVAFPGGATDPDDDGPVATALREASEEVGLNADSVDVLAELPPLFLPPSGFLITPVLAWWHTPHEVGVLDPAEVARVEVVPIAELAEPANRFRVALPRGGLGVGFATRGLFIWGFTAGLLDHVVSLGGWAQPWDTDEIRALPGSVVRPAPTARKSGKGTVAP